MYLPFMIFAFALYQPGPVSILEQLWLRGIVTFSDGQETLALINQGCGYVYTPDATLDVRVRINKDAFEVACHNPQEGALVRGTTQILKAEPANYLKQSIHQKYDLSIPFNGDRISHEDVVLLESTAGMNLQAITVQSPRVVLFAKRYMFNNYVCNTDAIVIASQDPNSLYDSIEFVFDKQSEAPHNVSGTLNFESGDGELTVLGVKTIKVQFSESAFASHGKPILEIKPGESLFKI